MPVIRYPFLRALSGQTAELRQAFMEQPTWPLPKPLYVHLRDRKAPPWPEDLNVEWWR